MRKQDLQVGKCYELTANKEGYNKGLQVTFKGIPNYGSPLLFVTLTGQKEVQFWTASHLKLIDGKSTNLQQWERVLSKATDKMIAAKEMLSIIEKDVEMINNKIESLKKFQTDEEEMEFILEELVRLELTSEEKKKYIKKIISNKDIDGLLIKYL